MHRVRGHHEHRDHVRGDPRLGQHIPSCRHFRTRDSARLGGPWTSGRIRLVRDITIGSMRKAYTKPDGNVGISWRAGATCVLLISVRLDQNGIIEGTYSTILLLADCPPHPDLYHNSRRFSLSLGFLRTYRYAKHLTASCQRYPHPPSFPESPIAPNQSTVRDRWGWFLALLQVRGGLLRF